MESNYNYTTLLNIISKNFNDSDKEFVDDNKEIIIDRLYELSNYVKDFIKNFSSYSSKDAYKKLSKKYKHILSNKEVKKILDLIQMKNLKGGELEKINEIGQKIDDSSVDICLNNLPLIFIKLLDPKIFFFIISNLFEYLSEMFTFKINWFDYTKHLDWVYLLLFILASVPVTGGFINMIIIFRALKDERFYLAISTTISTIISTILTLNIIDFGLLFKIFYYLDNKSYMRALTNIDGGEATYKNDLAQVVTFYKKDNKEPSVKIHSKILKSYIGNKDLSKQELQKLDDTLSNEEIMKNIIDNNPEAMNDPLKASQLLDTIKDNKEIADAIKSGDSNKAIELLDKTSKNDKLTIHVDGINSLRDKIEKNQYIQ